MRVGMTRQMKFQAAFLKLSVWTWQVLYTDAFASWASKLQMQIWMQVLVGRSTVV